MDLASLAEVAKFGLLNHGKQGSIRPIGDQVRAIDLYAGIGGWSLGLRLAGVEVVESYEWWQPAVDTHNGNHGGNIATTDVRKLKLSDLPSDIDIVVGSPPCTEFSYANRGGSGDLAEGLKDIVCFFEVVDHLKPKWWAMENVPRTAEVVRHGFNTPSHALYRFRHLQPLVEIVDFSDYGAAQARRRCIVSNIPIALVDAYKSKLPRRTLGDVIHALGASKTVVDPIWGVSLPLGEVTEMETEPALAGEELRMNREAKSFHAVYNNMAFPDRFDEPSRTVTATCTRVSRESIVIADPKIEGEVRRLSIRERASLQGFPITYQFYGRSFAEKAKMIGNAIPPTFTYLLASAAKGVSATAFKGLRGAAGSLSRPITLPSPTPPEKAGQSYPEGRSFRAALPGLRFKSGMRFELSNGAGRLVTDWKVRFFFGSSKDVREVELDGGVFSELSETFLGGPMFTASRAAFEVAGAKLARADNRSLQAAWSHRGEGVDPYWTVDVLGDLAAVVLSDVESWASDTANAVMAQLYVGHIADGAEGPIGRVPSASKLAKYALPVLAGLIVGDWFNAARHTPARRQAA